MNAPIAQYEGETWEAYQKRKDIETRRALHVAFPWGFSPVSPQGGAWTERKRTFVLALSPKCHVNCDFVLFCFLL